MVGEQGVPGQHMLSDGPVHRDLTAHLEHAKAAGDMQRCVAIGR